MHTSQLSNYISSRYYAHCTASFIEFIEIVQDNTVPHYSDLDSAEPLPYKSRILAFGTRIAIETEKISSQLNTFLDQVLYLFLSNSRISIRILILSSGLANLFNFYYFHSHRPEFQLKIYSTLIVLEI